MRWYFYRRNARILNTRRYLKLRNICAKKLLHPKLKLRFLPTEWWLIQGESSFSRLNKLSNLRRRRFSKIHKKSRKTSCHGGGRSGELFSSTKVSSKSVYFTLPSSLDNARGRREEKRVISLIKSEKLKKKNTSNDLIKRVPFPKNLKKFLRESRQEKSAGTYFPR